MAISVRKTIPASAEGFYTGSGDTTITLYGVTQIAINTKKQLMKIGLPQSASRQLSTPSDNANNKVLDLKRIEDTIKISGWLEDDATETAWNKAWKLRAMCTCGNVGGDKGALTSLTIDNINIGGSTQKAFIETVNFVCEYSGGNALNTNINDPISQTREGRARIRVDIDFYVGVPR